MNSSRKPLYTIITPTYNSGAKLEATAESVLSQNPNLYEYVVIDGASSDGTTALLQSYGNRLRWLSQPDMGVYDAMNKGIDLSRGRYIYFLGAGDTLKPDVLAHIAPLLPTQPLVFAYGNVQLSDSPKSFNGRYSRWKLSRVNICHQAIFCERSVFNTIGFFDLRYRVLSDYVFNLKCFGNPRITKKYLNEVIAEFEGGGLSARESDAQFLADRLWLFRRCLGFWPYAINKVISLIPSALKEGRYQAFRRMRARFPRHKG